MAGKYIKRSLEKVLKKAVYEFPAVVLTGPRQSGKTTLLKQLFSDEYRYVSLEPPDVMAAAMQDPRGFLKAFPPPVIFDEVQYVPHLLPYVKENIDADRDRPGQYLLTGSQNLLLMEKITESLSGRAAMLCLLPLSRREAAGRADDPLPWEKPKKGSLKPGVSYRKIWDDLLRGFYPEIVATPQRDINLWHSSYVRTYLERDVRMMRQVGEISQFHTFLRALAARSAQLLNLTDLAKDIGLSVNTASKRQEGSFPSKSSSLRRPDRPWLLLSRHSVKISERKRCPAMWFILVTFVFLSTRTLKLCRMPICKGKLQQISLPGFN